MLWKEVVRCCTPSMHTERHHDKDEIRSFLFHLKGDSSWSKLLHLFENETRSTISRKALENLSFCVAVIREEAKAEVLDQIENILQPLSPLSPHITQEQIDFLRHLSDVVRNHEFPIPLAATCVENVRENAQRQRVTARHSQPNSSRYPHSQKSESSSSAFSMAGSTTTPRQERRYDRSDRASSVSATPVGPGDRVIETILSSPARPS